MNLLLPQYGISRESLDADFSWDIRLVLCQKSLVDPDIACVSHPTSSRVISKAEISYTSQHKCSIITTISTAITSVSTAGSMDIGLGLGNTKISVRRVGLVPETTDFN